jgi:hypothetical protein
MPVLVASSATVCEPIMTEGRCSNYRACIGEIANSFLFQEFFRIGSVEEHALAAVHHEYPDASIGARRKERGSTFYYAMTAALRQRKTFFRVGALMLAVTRCPIRIPARPLRLSRALSGREIRL